METSCCNVKRLDTPGTTISCQPGEQEKGKDRISALKELGQDIPCYYYKSKQTNKWGRVHLNFSAQLKCLQVTPR